MKFNSILSLTAIALLASCGGQQSAQQTDEAAPQVCRYSYQHDSTSVKWTAYKFTEKVGVSGSFDEMEVTGTLAEEMTLVNVFGSAGFNIPVSSTNSLVPDRDMKIKEHFFGTMNATDSISGRVVSITEEGAQIEISMNGQTRSVDMDVMVNGSELMLEGVIQLADWDALASVDALNKICHDLHIGADGISKLWPEVKLEVRTVLTERCD
jgi:hypothetical protein